MCGTTAQGQFRKEWPKQRLSAPCLPQVPQGTSGNAPRTLAAEAAALPAECQLLFSHRNDLKGS